MFGIEQSAWIIGLQALFQALAITVLWGIVFQRLRFGGTGVLLALFPVLGLFAATGVTIGLGMMQISSFDLVIAFRVLPDLVAFLFSVAPLLFLTVRLRMHRTQDVFE